MDNALGINIVEEALKQYTQGLLRVIRGWMVCAERGRSKNGYVRDLIVKVKGLLEECHRHPLEADGEEGAGQLCVGHTLRVGVG